MKFARIYSILVSLSLILLTKSSLATETHFFIVAHPDDWQLFMNPNAFNKTRLADSKVVFIHTTSGDGGFGLGAKGEVGPYYAAREEGALRAVRFMVNSDAGGRGPHLHSSVKLNGHTLTRYFYGNSVVYFLRLPDGGPNSGTVNVESLQSLYDGRKKQVHTIDKTNNYNGWNDLVNTLSAIVTFESFRSPIVSLNFHDTDTVTLNSYDHADHIHTSLATQQVARTNYCVSQNLFVGYFSQSKAVNVTGDDLFADIGTWAVTTSGIADSYHSSSWGIAHNKWIGKNYFRTLPNNTALCKTQTNLATQAKASASSENTSSQQTATKAIDGIADGYPGNATREWVTKKQGAGAYLRLTWSKSVTISHVLLYDRPSLTDQITAAHLEFDNGKKISIPRLNNSGTNIEVSFNPINTQMLKLVIDSVREGGTNTGLAEIRVY